MNEENIDEDKRSEDNSLDDNSVENRTEETLNEKKSDTISVSKGQIQKYSVFIFLGIVLIGGFMIFNGKPTTGNVIAIGGNGEVVEVSIAIQGFKYSPDTITVKKGSTVKLTIQNKDNVLHGLHLPQFGLVDSTPPLATKTFSFTAIETSTNGQAVPTCAQEHGETLTINVIN